MLGTGSGVTVVKIAKDIGNPEIVLWSKVYLWANKVPIDTKTKEFQNKCVNDLLSNKIWLQKWNIVTLCNVFFTVKHTMKVLHICFGHAVVQNSLERISLTVVHTVPVNHC